MEGTDEVKEDKEKSNVVVCPWISRKSKPKEDFGIHLKPKEEVVAKSAAEIVHEQNGNSAPSARMATTRRGFPIVALNPYQSPIKVRVTNKGNLRTYNSAKGEGHVINVELTNEDGTQIQATMFNEAAKKFDKIFEMRQALANALEIAPCIWTFGNAGMGDLKVFLIRAAHLMSREISFLA